MCGIAGFLTTDSFSEHLQRVLHQMLSAMHHRGPDEEGSFLAEGVALGMRRLSIIDLAGGHQPIFNEDRKVAIVFNGEIYNFQTLRQELMKRGHQFATHSDTEVIVHAYEEWGVDCLQRLRGMFAFALYDGRNPYSPLVFLARDRLGIKPLYFYVSPSQKEVLFASEVRALLASSMIPREIDPNALPGFLLFGSVMEPNTLVKGVFSLPPGHLLRIQKKEGGFGLIQEEWWDLSSATSKEVFPRQKVLQEIRQVLEEAVRLHLIAEVPLGVFLSSGIDSTALAALASRVSEKPVHTFTVAFMEEDYNEAEMARHTARLLNTKHSELLVTGQRMLERMREAVLALDQPSMDGINTYFVSWSARQAGLKVALSGVGGDELFGGYQTFHLTPKLANFSRLATAFPAPLRTLGESGLRKVEGFWASEALRKLTSLLGSPGSFPHPYFWTRLVFTPSQVQLLCLFSREENGFLWRQRLDSLSKRVLSQPLFNQVSFLEMTTYMTNTLLRDTDCMSMAHSLEVRVPFLDHLVVERTFFSPVEYKIAPKIPKPLLVASLEDLLPTEVIHQRKRTFTFPWAVWLKKDLKESLEKSLSRLSPGLREYLSQEEIGKVWWSFLKGRTSWSRPWSLYVLNEWVKYYLDEVE